MEITYSWKVTGIRTVEAGDVSQFVFQTYWEKSGTDELGNVGKFTGATPFKKDPSQVDFIPFSQLTEEVVVGWIQQVVVGPYEDHVNQQIEKGILALRNPVSTPDLPWGAPNAVAPTVAPADA